MQRWSKHAKYTYEAKAKMLKTTLCLLYKFLAAIPSYTFRLTISFLVSLPSVAASIENLLQLSCYNLIMPWRESGVPWEFPHLAWQSEWQVVHNNYNLYKNLRTIWCEVRLWEVHKFVSLQPFAVQWQRIILDNISSTWKITSCFQMPNLASNEGNLHETFTDSFPSTFQLQASEKSTPYGGL